MNVKAKTAHVQFVHLLYNKLCVRSTANPQQIQQVKCCLSSKVISCTWWWVSSQVLELLQNTVVQ